MTITLPQVQWRLNLPDVNGKILCQQENILYTRSELKLKDLVTRLEQNISSKTVSKKLHILRGFMDEMQLISRKTVLYSV